MLVERKTSLTSIKINDEKSADEFAAKSLSGLFLFLKDDGEALQNYLALTAGYDDIPFAHSSNPELKRKFEVTNKYAQIVF